MGAFHREKMTMIIVHNKICICYPISRFYVNNNQLTLYLFHILIFLLRFQKAISHNQL